MKITQAQVKFFMHVAEEKALNEAGERVKMKLNGARGVLGSGRFEVDVTQEGLRIELIESSAQDQFFTSGSAELRPMGTAALELIAIELGALRNPVILEGHTDAKPFGSDRGYTNWELSADRANAARRALADAGLDPTRLKEVRGYADTRLRVSNDRFAPQNRRITIFLPFNTSPPDPPTVTAAPTAPAN
jgi:chemotaxis protein MotB